jgi:hypothetical protein
LLLLLHNFSSERSSLLGEKRFTRFFLVESDHIAFVCRVYSSYFHGSTIGGYRCGQSELVANGEHALGSSFWFIF